MPVSELQPPPAAISTAEYAARRATVLKALNGAAGLVFAGEGSMAHGPWTPDANFFAITGISDEPGAAVLLDPSAEDPRRRVVLFLKPLNPELERWDGHRDLIGDALRAKYGFETVMRTTALAMMLGAAARRSKRLACLHPFAHPEQGVSHDLAMFRKAAERVVGCTVEDRTEIFRRERSIKSAREIQLISHAVAITARGFASAMAALKPGVGERAIHRVLEQTYAQHGADGHAFEPIVGSGIHGTVLHYKTNNGPTPAGDLVVIDSGAKYAGYCADVTRTIPVSGRFSSEQRDLYQLVLDSQLASIEAVRPGATMTDVNYAARRIIEKAGLGDAFMHGIGHHLGIEVHDLDAGTPLQAGHVVTIEPGVYLSDRRIGIRIEDDVLVTKKGREVLSAMIPKTVAEVEAAMR